MKVIKVIGVNSVIALRNLKGERHTLDKLEMRPAPDIRANSPSWSFSKRKKMFGIKNKYAERNNSKFFINTNTSENMDIYTKYKKILKINFMKKIGKKNLKKKKNAISKMSNKLSSK